MNLESNINDSINDKQILNQIESVINDISNVKEKDLNSTEEYENIKVLVEKLQTKTKEVKLQMENCSKDIDSIDWQKQNLLIDNSHSKIEQYKLDFDQLKKGKLSHQVSNYE